MKRMLLLCAMFLVVPVTLAAKPAALLNNYVHENTFGISEQVVFFTDKILHGQAIQVAVEVPHRPEQQKQYEAYVQQLYDIWFNATANIIRASGRTEFNDLLPLFPEHVKIRFVTKDAKHDVEFKFVTSQEVIDGCGGDRDVLGCVKTSSSPLRVYVSDQFSKKAGEIVRTHLHEVGHTLGLGDQYYQGRNSNTNVNYASPVRKKSVMNNDGPKTVKGITADDADGLVLAVDVALRNYNRGGETGWKSLDPKSKLYYVHGKVGNSPHSFYLRSHDNFAQVNFVKYNENGVPVRQQILSFGKRGLDVFGDIRATRVISSDSQGRPIVEQGPNGETIYTSYFYESMHKLVLDKNDKVLRYEQSVFEDGKYKEIAYKDVYGGTHKEFIVLRGKIGYFVSAKEVTYYTYNWEGKHDALYAAKCTKKKCEQLVPSKPVAEQISHSASRLEGNLEQNVLFEKLKAWLKGKGSIKPQS